MEKDFSKIIKTVKSEQLGINLDDGLFLVEHIKSINPEIIIESGRARGVSTEIFAKCFPEKLIISIDFDKNSQNSKYSEKKLKKYKNVKIVYGDSREIIFKYLKNKKAHVFIDGPKGHEAILLSKKVFENENVISISLDDFPKNTYYTNILESIFGNIQKSYQSFNKQGRAVIIDKKTSKINKQAFKNYINWFEQIRPFYTKWTYKLKPGLLTKLLGVFNKE